ncbi:hypothetical protein K438DRAFT_1975579 [Mycena galopus ATCC 62051]|nr:hypothetical protein K438DRAFT_1975579 [Mycena galopus ATCC 62051]
MTMLDIIECALPIRPSSGSFRVLTHRTSLSIPYRTPPDANRTPQDWAVAMERLMHLSHRRHHAAARAPRPDEQVPDCGDAPDAQRLFLLSTRSSGNYFEYQAFALYSFIGACGLCSYTSLLCTPSSHKSLVLLPPHGRAPALGAHPHVYQHAAHDPEAIPAADDEGGWPPVPPKKSCILYERLGTRQRETYEAVLGGRIRACVPGAAGAKSVSASAGAGPSQDAGAGASKASLGSTADEEEKRAGRTMCTRRCSGQGTDAEREEEEDRGQKQANDMKLQNTVMQLRKVFPHPFRFARKSESRMWVGRLPPTPALLATREAELFGASRKMLLLDSSRVATAEVAVDLPIDVLPTSALLAVHEAELLGASSRRCSTARRRCLWIVGRGAWTWGPTGARAEGRRCGLQCLSRRWMRGGSDALAGMMGEEEVRWVARSERGVWSEAVR